MMPSCDQTGVPRHFHSSTIAGSASWISLRILLRVSPRQSASSAILFEMSSEADWPSLALDFFMSTCPMVAKLQYGVRGIVFSSAFPPVAQAERQALKADSYLC